MQNTNKTFADLSTVFRPVISRSIICSVNYGIHHHTNLNVLMLFNNVPNTSFILKLYLYLCDSIDHKIAILRKLSLRSLIRRAPEYVINNLKYVDNAFWNNVSYFVAPLISHIHENRIHRNVFLLFIIICDKLYGCYVPGATENSKLATNFTTLYLKQNYKLT